MVDHEHAGLRNGTNHVSCLWGDTRSLLPSLFPSLSMHRKGESTAATERMHRDGESRADYASLRRSDGSDRAYASRFAMARAGRQCITTADQRQATEHTLRRREQGRLCITTADQRQRQSTHRDGESRADYASLRQSDVSDNSCIASRADYASLRS